MARRRANENARPPGTALWRARDFRTLWGGQTASLFGDQVTGLALPWLILLRTHSAVAVGVVAAARYLPIVLLGLVAGLVADRFDRRALMLASDLLRALALGAIAILAALGQPPALWLLIGVVLALGCGQLFFSVAYRAWLPDLVGAERLSAANAALEASDAASVLVGYPLAGALIAAVGPTLALGADGLSYVCSALTLVTLRSQPSVAVPGKSGVPRSWNAMVADALVGVRVIVRDPTQRLLRLIGSAFYLDAGAVTLLLAVLAQLELRLTAWQAGLVFGAMGAGGLLSSGFAARLYRWDWRRGLALACLLAALGSLGLAWAGTLESAHGFLVALVADLVLDGAVALGFVLLGTATTLATAPESRGRVNAASTIYSSLVRGLAALGAGLLAAHFGTGGAFASLAAIFICAALLAWRGRAGRSPSASPASGARSGASVSAPGPPWGAP